VWVFAYLRPVLGEKRAPRSPSPMTGMLAERSLYRLDASFQNDERPSLSLVRAARQFSGARVGLHTLSSVCRRSCVSFRRSSAYAQRRQRCDPLRAVSIDPAHDTQRCSTRYRAKLGLSPDRWLLLRGEPNSIRELSALLGFSYSSADDGMPLAHSKLVTVLNREGVIIHQQESVSADSQKIVDAIARAL